jgi:putative Holliday junction resolvase
MRYLGIDYGAKRVGIAISDEGGGFAFPKGELRNDASLIAALVSLAQKEGAAAFVVGDTRTLEGAANVVTARSDEFAAALAAATNLPVHRVREAWSSAEAMRYAPAGKRHDDSAAAAILLQRFLDGSHRV